MGSGHLQKNKIHSGIEDVKAYYLLAGTEK